MELVGEAVNGREAIEVFRKTLPDVTLMDLQMPEMNGLDALIAIRAEFHDAKIVMDRGLDPYGFSSNDYVAVLENRILMAVDKYQAAVARGRKAHGEAMDVIKRILAPKYEGDAMMNRVLKVLDALGKEESLFAAAA